MNQKNTNRSGLGIMARLIVLVGPLLPFMVLAVALGVAGFLCATAITLRAKTGIDHWTITVRGGTLRVDVTDDDVKLTGSATIVGKIELL